MGSLGRVLRVYILGLRVSAPFHVGSTMHEAYNMRLLLGDQVGDM